MHSVQANIMLYHTVSPQKHHSLFRSAQHFEIDLNLYNTDMFDYAIVNDSLVGFIDVVYVLKYPKQRHLVSETKSSD